MTIYKVIAIYRMEYEEEADSDQEACKIVQDNLFPETHQEPEMIVAIPIR